MTMQHVSQMNDRFTYTANRWSFGYSSSDRHHSHQRFFHPARFCPRRATKGSSGSTL